MVHRPSGMRAVFSFRSVTSLHIQSFHSHATSLPTLKRPRLVSRGLHHSLLVRACGNQHDASHGHFTVTTPLYYVNAAPHMGSAYPTIAADALARFHRLQGRRVMFVTGTDEHGEKIALAAEKRGMDPKQHCDDVVASYKSLWREVRFSLTTYG